MPTATPSTMPTKALLLTMADYHAWAFEALYEALLTLDDDGYRSDRGLFFGSVHGTLNHLLLADRVWFGRVAGEPYDVAGLDVELEPDRARLEQALLRQARSWRPWIEARDETALSGMLEYRNLAGTTFSNPLAPLLLHVFNHGTHHRGQISTAVTALGRPPPEMDLIVFLRGAGAPLPTV